MLRMPAAGVIATEALTLCRYAANIGVVLLNKYLLSYYGFRFPVLLTLLHMVACSLLTAATVAGGFVRVQRLKTQRQFAKVTLLSMAFTVVIVLGNVSLRLIPVSFNQALGACTPLFTAILERVVQNKHESFWTYTALVPVVLGIIVATGFEPSFHLIGFAACMLATALRAFKTVLQVRPLVCDTSAASLNHLAICALQRHTNVHGLTAARRGRAAQPLVLQTCAVTRIVASGTEFDQARHVVQAVLLSEPTEKLNSFNLLLYMAPLSTLALVPATLILEPQGFPAAQQLLADRPGFLQILLVNCLLAFSANLFNFLITRHTSALTLQVRA